MNERQSFFDTVALAQSSKVSIPNPVNETFSNTPSSLSTNLVTYITATRIISQPTTTSTAYEKSLFYDEVARATKAGLDEMTAIDKGSQVVREFLLQQEEEAERLREEKERLAEFNEVKKETVNVNTTVSTRVEDENTRVVDATISESQTQLQSRSDSQSQTQPQTQTQPPHNPAGSVIHAKFQNIEQAVPVWPRMNSLKHPRNGKAFRKGLGGGTLSGFAKQIVRPSVKLSIKSENCDPLLKTTS